MPGILGLVLTGCAGIETAPTPDVREVLAPTGKLYYLWRPYLKDPKDDLVLEAAVAGSCEAIITYNRRDFAGAENFGVRILTPGQFLRRIGEL
jgi:hypothetical protein